MEPDSTPQPPRKARLRQTFSYLRGLLEQHGIRPKNKLGQNFLVDLNILDVVVRAAELSPNDLAIEIGTGTGSLTQRLADQAGAVLSVEIDAPFHSLASELVEDRDNVVLLLHDVLKNKNQLAPEVLSALRELWQQQPERPLKMVANLPYSVATPVLANFLLSEFPIERFVVTVQWEIAERLMARPGTRDYGSLAVLVQSLADVELVRKLPPSVFWPRPLVDSAIVRIMPNAEKRRKVPSPERFRHFLRDLYTQRRKNLRAALTGLPSGRLPKPEVDARLAALGMDGSVRAENLSIEDHLRLCEAFTM